jgi:hypothetical protein
MSAPPILPLGAPLFPSHHTQSDPPYGTENNDAPQSPSSDTSELSSGPASDDATRAPSLTKAPSRSGSTRKEGKDDVHSKGNMDRGGPSSSGDEADQGDDSSDDEEEEDDKDKWSYAKQLKVRLHTPCVPSIVTLNSLFPPSFAFPLPLLS